MINASMQTSYQFGQLNAAYRQKYASNPNDPAAYQELQDARQQVVQEQQANVPGIVSRDYTNKTVELTQSSDASNNVWAIKQMRSNAISDLQSGRDTSLKQANQAGQDYANNGGGDPTAALNYMQANALLQTHAAPILGADKTGAFLKDFNSDYTKSFFVGVAGIDPKMAASMLSDPSISQHFTTQDIGDMTNLIARTEKQQQLAQSLQTTKNDGQLTDIVNDTDTTYFEKRAAIDRLDMQGAVTSKAAASARRVLTSSNDLDAQTDTPAMADVINKVYSLNAIATTKPADYLDGVRDIQQQVLDLQGNNQLTAGDASKLTKQINNLTEAKLGAATNTAGMEFFDANQNFDKLPPEYRGQATRALFYAAHGQDMTPDQLNNQATKIIDQINDQRRTQALTTVSRVANDDVFLKSAGYTREQIAQAAQNKGISQQQVIQLLRGKYSSKQRPSARAGAQTETPEEAGSTQSPEPQITMPVDENEQQ